MTKQVIFCDQEGTVHAGLLLDDGYIVCGCCGSLIEPDDYVLFHVYENWVDIEKILETTDATELLKSL